MITVTLTVFGSAVAQLCIKFLAHSIDPVADLSLGLTIPAFITAVIGLTSSLTIGITGYRLHILTLPRHWYNVTVYVITISLLGTLVVINGLNMRDGDWLSQILLYFNLTFELSLLPGLWWLYWKCKKVQHEAFESDSWYSYPAKYGTLW